MNEEKKDIQKSNRKKSFMFAYGFIQLGSALISAIALVAISFELCSIKKESQIFNDCVAEVITEGSSQSEAVRYCNGG